MLQYILTGLAGIALGIVSMRVWQLRDLRANEAVPVPAGPLHHVDAAQVKVPSRIIFIGAAALVVAAIGVMIFRPEGAAAPDSAPLNASPNGIGSPQGKALDDVDTMMQRLADRLAKNPQDGEGFRMLGWSYVMTGNPDKAIEPYQKALSLLPKQSNVHAGFGEALVGVAKGTVTEQAKAEFDVAVKLDPNEPRARYFEALWLAQHGQEKMALERWIVLANDGPADASWQDDVKRQIRETATKLGIDVSSRIKHTTGTSSSILPTIPNDTLQAAAALPPADQQAMIDKMIEGLAAKLVANPKDADGWIKLLRSRMVLGQKMQAERDLQSARKGLASSPVDLARVEAAAKENGVPVS